MELFSFNLGILVATAIWLYVVRTAYKAAHEMMEEALKLNKKLLDILYEEGEEE